MAHIALQFAGFEWDGGNREKNLRKHGITCVEAEEVCRGNPLVYPDTIHSTTSEQRYVLFGETPAARLLFIAFTVRSRKIRIISARPMSQKERNWYEKEKKKITP